MEDYKLSLQRPNTRVSKPSLEIETVPADQFSYAQLTDFYNQTRVDYLVPMPMNERKLREYCHIYDLDLAQSSVAVLGDEVLGLIMMGVRGDQTWVTRMGVVPNGRKKGIGQKLMDQLIRNSRQIGAKKIILDVIKGNIPAEKLFLKFGFKRLREMYVVRRPPKPINIVIHGMHVEVLGYQEALTLLEKRSDKPSWISDTRSMRNAGNLAALYADLPSGGKGWLVYQNTVFQLARLVIETEAGDPAEVTTALLENLHWHHQIQDTICENVPIDAPHWPAMQKMGYIISFNRFEMEKDLRCT